MNYYSDITPYVRLLQLYKRDKYFIILMFLGVIVFMFRISLDSSLKFSFWSHRGFSSMLVITKKDSLQFAGIGTKTSNKSCLLRWSNIGNAKGIYRWRMSLLCFFNPIQSTTSYTFLFSFDSYARLTLQHICSVISFSYLFLLLLVCVLLGSVMMKPKGNYRILALKYGQTTNKNEQITLV